MQSMKLTVLLSALALGVTASVSAQNVEVIEAPAISNGQVVGTVTVIVPAPQPTPDPAAATKCQNVSPASYWDCVNSHNGGQ
jgi:hypothetical protein